MKLLFSLFIVFITATSLEAKQSELVDVSKNSKLSNYFKEINKKVSNNSEEKALKVVKKKEVKNENIVEEDILLQAANQKKKKSSSMSPINKMMVSVFGILIFGVLFFAGVQKMSKKKGHSSIAKNIKILTQKSLGPKKNLILIRVAGETILLGVTDHNINHIKTLSLMEDELPNYVEPQFSNHLKDKIEETGVTDNKEVVDGFSLSRLDDVKNAVTERFSIS